MTMEWLRFGGLLLDLIGFGVLAWDLWPRYNRERYIRTLQHTLECVSAMYAFSTNDDGSQFYVNDQRELTRRVLNAWKSHGWHVSQRIEDNSDKIDILTEAECDDMEPRLAQMIAREKLWLDNFNREHRPPIGFGIACILAGFALQIIGSTPQSLCHLLGFC